MKIQLQYYLQESKSNTYFAILKYNCSLGIYLLNSYAIYLSKTMHTSNLRILALRQKVLPVLLTSVKFLIIHNIFKIDDSTY